MSQNLGVLEEKIARLERENRRTKAALVAGLGSAAVLFCAAMTQQSQITTADIIRAKGIIIEDDAGRPRILLGAPAPTVEGRKRRDGLTGLVYIDENGADRVTLGADPDPMTANGVVARRTGGAGILLHDKDGVERGGYGVLDDNMAVLTLDWPKTGEGLALMSNNQFSGLALYHRNDPGIYKQAMMLAVSSSDPGTYVSFNDVNGKQRMSVGLAGTMAPEIMTWDSQGQRLQKRDLE